MLQSTAELLDTKLAPLQQELEDLKRKQGLLEAKHKALEAEVKDLKKKQGNTPPTTSTTLPFLPPALDPATKRAAFVGWPEKVAADDRFQQMEALLTSTFPDFKPLTYLNDYKGPYNNRKLGSVSFVEFGNKDTARNFVKAVEERGATVQSKGKQLLVKQAQTQKQPSASRSATCSATRQPAQLSSRSLQCTWFYLPPGPQQGLPGLGPSLTAL